MQRRVLWILGLAFAAIVAATAFLGRDPIAEHWHLWRLRAASDEEDRRRSAVALGEMGSVRAVRPLLELEYGPTLATVPQRQVDGENVQVFSTVSSPGGPVTLRGSNLSFEANSLALDSTWTAVIRMIGARGLPALCEAYRDASDEVAECIARLIRRVRVTEEHAGVLLRILSDDELQPLWRDAVYKLTRLETGAQRLEPALVELTRSPHAELRRHAIAALRAVAQRPDSHLQRLVELTEDPDGKVRTEAAYSLGAFRVDTPRVKTALRTLELDADERVSRTASWALQRIERNSTP